MSNLPNLGGAIAADMGKQVLNTLVNPLKQMEVLGKTIKGIFSGVGAGITKVGDKLTKGAFSKFGDSMKKYSAPLKKVGSVFKDLAGSSLQAYALEKAMMLISTLMMLLEPFNVIFELINGMLGAFVGGVLSQIMPAMQPIFDLLVQLIPSFMIFGQLIGGILAQAITAIIPLFVQLSPLINVLGKIFADILITALNMFIPIIMRLVPIFEIILPPVINAIIWVFGLLSGAMKALEKVWNTILEPVFAAISYAFAWVAYGIAGVINFINTIIQKIDFADIVPDFGVAATKPTLPAFAEGGIVSGPTLGLLGEAGTEAVIPLSKLDEMLAARDERMLDVLSEIEYNTRSRFVRGRLAI